MIVHFGVNVTLQGGTAAAGVQVTRIAILCCQTCEVISSFPSLQFLLFPSSGVTIGNR